VPFIIDQQQCVQCGSCIGNCPNRAIVRRGAAVIITDMCCDCGTCIPYCGVKAIAGGEQKAEFSNTKLDAALKHKLSLNRVIAAMKFADTAPAGVMAEDGLNFWCHICGDIFEGSGNPVFFTAENSVCGGSSALGLGSRTVSRENVLAVMEVVAGDGGYFANNELFTQARSQFPKYPHMYGGIVLGSLAQVKMPDLILVPLNGKQMCMVSTAYSFETGELISGNAGGGTCLGSVATPFLENKPVFTCGDHGGRMHMRLRDEEILACIPYRLVPGLVKNLDKTIYNQE
jgi:uncharacterized protein (DUF169 family)/NAD-dependent dihydropyrimidine dehydrogenase PreA subunit